MAFGQTVTKIILQHQIIEKGPKTKCYVGKTQNQVPIPYQQRTLYLFHFFLKIFFGQILDVRWRKGHSVREVMVHRAADE